MEIIFQKPKIVESIKPKLKNPINGKIEMRVVLLLSNNEVKVFGGFDKSINVLVETEEPIKFSTAHVYIFNGATKVTFSNNTLKNVKRMHFYMVQGEWSYISMDPNHPFNTNRIKAEPVFKA